MRAKRDMVRVGVETALAFLGWTAIVLGLSGVLAPPTVTLGSLETPTLLGGLVGAALFLAVSIGARLLAFPLSGLVPRLPPSTALSLDGAILVAGTLSVGAPLVAAGLAISMTVDTVVRGIAGARARSHEGVVEKLSPVGIARRALYTGGVAGGLLIGCAAVFGAHLRNADERMGMVAAFGLSFLGAHAIVQLAHSLLRGQPLRPTCRRVLVALAAEATLLPIGAVIVHIWDEHHPAAFVLLGVTYLFVNFGFYRIARITAALRGRVRELATLSRTAQSMAAELEVPGIVSALLRETHRALPFACTIELRLTAPATVEGYPQVERHALERGRQRVRCTSVPRCEWDDAAVLHVDEHLDAAPGATQSRLVAPLRRYGESLGVLVIESRHDAPFGANEARLIEAVAGQATSALENARLHALANFDGLTGLYCRRYFDSRLGEEIERARRFETGFCVLLLDIDNFKKLNDSRGHLAGDRALREVARLAQAQLRNVDLAARYGGEELVFILPRTPLTDAHVVAERIRDAVSSHVFVDIGHVSVSIGVAAFSDTSSDSGQLASNVLGRADLALYRAKALGKDRVEVDLGPIELTPSLAPVLRRRRA
ncbi:MAG: diguanylate cyclase [Polyangia bacterium]